MRVLVLGGSGMLGHKLWQRLAGRHDAWATFRCGGREALATGLFDAKHIVSQVAVEDFDSVVRATANVQPQTVVNCVGVVKQAAAATDPVPYIGVNALFPHRLAELCRAAGFRLVHISTDCVFLGEKGGYAEDDPSDARDLYGRSKSLGEVAGPGCLTLRTSMIGRELRTSHGLIEWFLGQRGRTIKGYARAIFSGFTTLALASIIEDVITRWPELEGVWHVASEPISKFDLLTLVRDVYGLNIDIERDTEVVCDRSLCGARFAQATGFRAPSWRGMIEAMRDDPTTYDEIRRRHAH